MRAVEAESQCIQSRLICRLVRPTEWPNAWAMRSLNWLQTKIVKHTKTSHKKISHENKLVFVLVTIRNTYLFSF